MIRTIGCREWPGSSLTYCVLSNRGWSRSPAVGARHRHGSLEVTVSGGLTPSSMVNLVVSVVADGLAVAHSWGKRAIVAPSIAMATVDSEDCAICTSTVTRGATPDGVSKMAAVLPPGNSRKNDRHLLDQLAGAARSFLAEQRIDSERGGRQVDGAGKRELRVERHLGASLTLGRTNVPDPVGRAPGGEPAQVEDGDAVLVAIHHDRAVGALGVARPPHQDGVGGRGGGRRDDRAAAVLRGALPRAGAGGDGAIESVAADRPVPGARAGDREHATGRSEGGTKLKGADVTVWALPRRQRGRGTHDTARIGESGWQAQVQ